jgi:heptosyltransferase-2
MNEKVLIIKIGFSEVLDDRVDGTISLGDVIRCTAILNLYKPDKVTWLTAIEAVPLLINNPYIDRVLIYDLTTVLQLQAEQFDTIVNLEKVPGICALTDSIKAWKRFGFRFDTMNGDAEAYLGAQETLELSSNTQIKKRNGKKSFLQNIFQIVGVNWDGGEEYILGYQPKSKEVYDLGFNTHVGNKWPSKSWSMENWKKLEKLVEKDYSNSWQKGLNNLYEYMDWLNSCRIIITNDSLGLHLGLALKKKVVALFGPTFSNEINMYNRGIIINADGKRECIPCMKPTCKYKKKCIDYIKPEVVFEKIKEINNHGVTRNITEMRDHEQNYSV